MEIRRGGRRSPTRLSQPEVRHVHGRDAVLWSRGPGPDRRRVQLPIFTRVVDRELLEEYPAIGIRGNEGDLADQPALCCDRARDRDRADVVRRVLVGWCEGIAVLVHHVQRARTVERQGPPVTLGVRPGYRGCRHGRERRKQLAGFQAFGQGSKRPSRRRWLSHRHGSDTFIPGSKAERPTWRTTRTPIKARPEPNPQRHRRAPRRGFIARSIGCM